MSRDKTEDEAKKRKRVRKKTEQTKRTAGQTRKPENPWGFEDLFGGMWGDREDRQDSKKG